MRRAAFAVLVSLLVFVGWLARPLAPRGLTPHPAPAADYASAYRILDSLSALDGADIAPACRTIVLSHGIRTHRVVVMFHGLTNCPAQFDSLAHLVFATGANVLVPRLPRHGLADRMTTVPARSNAAELAQLTDRTIDAAAGLGDTIVVVGLSTGGAMAAWAAQQRLDVKRAVLLAPLFEPLIVPHAFLPLVVRVLERGPNFFLWWNDDEREALRGPTHVYPRFASRSITATVELGADVTRHAELAPPSAREIEIITMGNDAAVSNRAIARVASRWSAHPGVHVTTYEFPGELGLSHDIVDPEQVGANTGLTYPVILRAIGP